MSEPDSYDPYGKFTYYWQICSNNYSSNKCGKNGIAACSYITNPGINGNAIDACGETLLNTTYVIDGNSSIIQYSLNDNSGVLFCSGTNVYRSISIRLSCGNGPLTISNVSQPNKCQYKVTMIGSILCNLQPSSSEKSSEVSSKLPLLSFTKKLIIILLLSFVFMLTAIILVYLNRKTIFKNIKIKSGNHRKNQKGSNNITNIGPDENISCGDIASTDKDDVHSPK